MMNIILQCGGMPFNGTTIEHQSLGGSETSAYYLAKHLVALGHRVTVFTSIQPEEEGCFDGVNYISHGQVTEAAPMGLQFHAYAENTPTDVCIIQRHPQAFQFKWASKVNIWWLHDLALKRSKHEVSKHMWNVDAVWCVSDYHKNQVSDVWNLKKDFIHVVKNGIDQDLFKGPIGEWGMPQERDKTKLLYSSRPERGLEHLIAPNGIMERLGDDFILYVCAYDNVTPSTQKYYEYLASRCNVLPNVVNLESLNKKQLADLMRECDLHIYPTNFEEVSCITAMEDMAAGLPMITSKHAALPETCKNSGTVLIPLKNGDVDVSRFVDAIKKVTKKYQKLVDKQVAAAPKFHWNNVVNGYVDSLHKCFSDDKSQEAIVKHLVEHSDIVALDYYRQTCGELSEYSKWLIDKTVPMYAFADDPKKQEDHYESYYASSELRKETMENSPRFDYVAGRLSGFDDGSTILDYGCGHGHFTINLAKRYPHLEFIGIDVSSKNIQFAKDWAKEEGLTNIQFYYADITQGTRSDFWTSTYDALDCVLCLEVIEHVINYREIILNLVSLLKGGGEFIASTPYGRWEWRSFEEYGDYRFHLHHFERGDINDIIDGCSDSSIVNIPAGNDDNGYLLGSYVWSFTRQVDNILGTVDYRRKFAMLKPRQLCALNIIAKDCQDTIAHTINSTLSFVDEIVVGIDKSTTDDTHAILMPYYEKLAEKNIRFSTLQIDPALETGFSKARNAVLKHTDLDWILWIDADEVTRVEDNTRRLLRSNQFNGYAIRQHHFSLEPAGILKTDLPLRLFRNNIGIKFHGLIHEHPEIKLNDGAGHAQLIDAVTIAHHGYDSEETRRGRFERNLDLMIRDREENPTRKLGKMLWVRDLSMMNQYELEHNGGRITRDILVRCEEGIKTWRELIKLSETRLVLECMEFYNNLMKLRGYEFEAVLSVGMSKHSGDTNVSTLPAIKGLFANRKDVEDLTMLLLDENHDNFDSKYY